MNEGISQVEADRMRGDKIHEELYGVKYAAPKLSIQVGAQVRLTGVVSSQAGNGTVHVKFYNVRCEIIVNAEDVHYLEVIRPPFKRGEVVRAQHDLDDEWLVVADECDGKALSVLADTKPGHTVVALEVKNYERRP